MSGWASNLKRNTQRARVFDGMLLVAVFVLLVYAVLISGGGRAFAGTLSKSNTSVPSVTDVDSSCPPCEAARQAKIKEDKEKASTRRHENTPIENTLDAQKPKADG